MLLKISMSFFKIKLHSAGDDFSYIVFFPRKWMDLLHPRPYPQDAEWEDPAYVDVNLGPKSTSRKGNPMIACKGVEFRVWILMILGLNVMMVIWW